jgi:uncharacterized membrane protein YedE/YeeE
MLEAIIDQLGDSMVMMLIGLVVGLVFGAAAQHSRFCLRAAIVETAGRKLGAKLALWLLAFSAAVMFVQAAIFFEHLDVSDARQLSATGSMSGAIVGGLMFGIGMVLARGCASRLLVLSATGNLRAIVTGLILTLVAQASLRGFLSPARETLGGLWLVEGGEARNLLHVFSVGNGVATLISLAVLFFTCWLAKQKAVKLTHGIGAIVVGFAVALGWVLTYQVSQVSFEPIGVQSVSFTGPSTDTLMALVNERDIVFTFGLGLVPGVFLGSGLMALATGEFEIQRFGPETKMERYFLGAFLMGFGSMLAGGCAVGAGVTGGAVFAITAWVAIFSMWMGGLLTQWLVDRPATC